jgi:flagellar protein FlbD
LIEYVEAVPDTTITLTTGNKFVVRESVNDFINKVTEFRKKCNSFIPMIKEDINNG